MGASKVDLGFICLMNAESGSNVRFYNRLSELRQLALGLVAANAGSSFPKGSPFIQSCASYQRLVHLHPERGAEVGMSTFQSLNIKSCCPLGKIFNGFPPV